MVLSRRKDGNIFKIKSINQISATFSQSLLEEIEDDMVKATKRGQCPVCVLDRALEEMKLCAVATVTITMNNKEIFKMTVSDSSILTEEFLEHCLDFFIHD